MVDDLVHVEVLVGAAAADERQALDGVRQLPVGLVAFIEASVDGLDGIMAFVVVVAVIAGLFGSGGAAERRG